MHKFLPLTHIWRFGILASLLISCNGLGISTQNNHQSAPVTQSNQYQAQLKEGQNSQTTPVPPVFGQHIKFETLSVAQGLSQSTVNAIAEDRHGFLWFGTWDGLNRYDGYQFKVYKFDPEDQTSISNNTIRDIFFDRKGVMWVGTDRGLNKYDPELDQFIRFQHNPEDSYSLSHDIVSRIFEDYSGQLWIGTLGGGLNLFDPVREQFIHFQNNPGIPASMSSNIIWDILEDKSGRLWIGTRAGLDRFNSQTGEFIHFRHDRQNLNSLADNDVRVLFEENSGDLWIGTYGGGLERFDRHTERFLHHKYNPEDTNSLSDNEVRTIFGDRSGVMWVGTSSGLNQYRPERDDFLRYGEDVVNSDDQGVLSYTPILDIFQDRSGVYWLATAGGGLNYFDQSLQRFVHIYHHPNQPNSLSNNNVSAILEDQDGVLWIGTESGLNRSNRQTGQFDHFNHDPSYPDRLSNDAISAIFQDRDGNSWIGTDNGLNTYAKAKDQIFAYKTDPFRGFRNVGELPSIDLSKVPITVISQDQNGVIWLGSNGEGLIRLNPSNKQVLVYPSGENDPENLNGSTVLSILPDRNGLLWIGTLRGGLNQFDPTTEQFKHYISDPGNHQSLSDNTVNAILEDETGTIWVGTSSGLNKFNPSSQTFVQYRQKDGLPNDFIHGIIEDEQGFLWISTNNGIAKFDPSTETFRNYSPQDGLQSNEFNQGAYYQHSSGRLYFGGINGLNIFAPNQIIDNPYIPPIVFTDLTQGGDVIDQSMAPENIQEIILHWPQNYFEFEFAALNYIQSENNQYAYKLEGIDNEWISVGNRRYGRYTNLPGGTYTLRIKGSNNDGLWNEEGTSIQVTVVPPFWETGWFRWGAVIVIVALVFTGYRLRMHNIQIRNQRLTAEIEERTRELEQRRQVAEGLREVLVLLNSDRSLEESLNFILCQINQFTEAQRACLIQIDQDQNVQVLSSYSSQEENKQPRFENQNYDLDYPQELLTWLTSLIRDATTPVITNPNDYLRVHLDQDGSYFDKVDTVLVIPVSPEIETLIGLVVMFTERREFSEEELDLVNTFADQASLAIANAHLRAQAEEVAIITERNRLARDLHDAVTQTLFSASLIAEAIPDIWIADREEGLNLLNELQHLNRGALVEMRALLMELRPTTLEESKLADLLVQLGEVVAGRADIEVHLDVNNDANLPTEVRISLYRIAQEALTNIVKHAQASRAALRLHSQHLQIISDQTNSYVQTLLEIQDNGCGFDPNSVPHDRFGLTNIHERAESIGAQVEISSQPGKGTQILVSWEGEEEAHG